MTNTICRIYPNAQNAAAAVEELKEHRALAENIRVVAPPAEGADNSLEAITKSIMDVYVLRSEAKVLAHAVQKGGTLVVVHAPFSTGLFATETLDAHGPIDSGLREPEQHVWLWDDAAPLSSTFRIGTKCDGAAPFSDFFSMKTLLEEKAADSNGLKSIAHLSANHPEPFSAFFGIATLSKSASPLSDTINFATISNNPTPLSSLLKLPTLIGR